MRILALAAALIIGCGTLSTPTDIQVSSDYVVVNEVRISSLHETRNPNWFSATWDSNPIHINAVSAQHVANNRSTLKGILDMVRNSGASSNPVPYTRVGTDWPDGTSIYGVMRGEHAGSFSQGQFLIEAGCGNPFLTIWANDTPIAMDMIDAFFDATEIDKHGLRFPIDANSAKLNQDEPFRLRLDEP